MRLFFLKQLERRGGASFLRGCLQAETLADAPWMVQWRRSGDSGFLRFLGKNSLPRLNPFAELPSFEPIHAAVGGFLRTGVIGDLEAALAMNYTLLQMSGRQGDFKGSLLAALFFDVFLLRLLPEARGTPTEANAAALVKWLAATPAVLATCCDAREMAVLCLFAGAVRGGGT